MTNVIPYSHLHMLQKLSKISIHWLCPRDEYTSDISLFKLCWFLFGPKVVAYSEFIENGCLLWVETMQMGAVRLNKNCSVVGHMYKLVKRC